MTKIYLDQDNVLMDFNYGLEKFNVKNDTTFIHRPKSEWTELQIRLDRQVVDCMNNVGFFEYLPVMSGADKLWEEVDYYSSNGPYVLTAYPKTSVDKARVADEKRRSIEKNFDKYIGDRFICCAREEKKIYAMSGLIPNILIDDMESNCQEWISAGGLAILFKDTNQAIQDLRSFMGG